MPQYDLGGRPITPEQVHVLSETYIQMGRYIWRTLSNPKPEDWRELAEEMRATADQIVTLAAAPALKVVAGGGGPASGAGPRGRTTRLRVVQTPASTSGDR